MDLRKAWQIALRDVRITFEDRNLLLIMFLAPLALTFIIGAAFSGFSGGAGDVPINDIKAAVVNEDEGVTLFLVQNINFGTIITDVLVPPAGSPPDPVNTLWKLINAQKMTREEAIAAVNKGELAAAVIIPKGFSAALNPAADAPESTTVTLYRDAGSPLTASIVASVVRGIVNNVVSGNIAIFAAGQVQPSLKIQAQQIAEKMADAAQTPPIAVNEVILDGGQTPTNFSPAQYFAPAIAVFFLTFTMSASATSIIEEQTSWTLQRMLTTPTTPATVLAGKLGGTFLTGLFQLLVLIVLMALINPALGNPTAVWGNNPLLIVLLAVVTTAAATGIGSLIAALAKTSEQANAYGGAFLTLMGLLGGAFFDLSNIPVLGVVTRFTMNFWATNGFSTVARGGDFMAILPNMIVLLVIYVVGFSIAIVLFNRRVRA
jgi:ABC-2 type transport system permease protein